MKGIFINVEKNRYPEVVDIEQENYIFQDYLNCDWMDFAYREIDGKKYTFIVDDTGLYKENPKPAIIDEDLDVHMVGNVLIFGFPDRDGELTGLSKEDIKSIMKHTVEIRKKGDEFAHVGLLI